MGNGCLAPRARNTEIYLQILNNIHQQTGSISIENEEELYNSIKVKIAKNGQLKKLMDYLSSHKTKVSDAMSHNYLLTSQAKSKVSKYTGLIISDYLMKSIFQTQIEMNKQLFTRSTKAFSLSQNNSGLSEQPKINNHQLNHHVSFFYQMNKLQQTYLNLILHEIKQQEMYLYIKCVQSLIKYSEYRGENNGQLFPKNSSLYVTQKVQNILDVLLKYINKGYACQQSIKAYSGLITLVKWSPQSKINYDALRYFLRLWLLHKQEDSLLTFQCEAIIKQYMQFCIANQYSTSLYQIIVEIYDECEFKNCLNLQNMLLSILSENDLKIQFLRGIFLYLLGYISWCKDQTIQNRWNSIYPAMTENARLKYQNIYLITTKIQSIKTIKRWLKLSFVQINDIFKYSHVMFILAFFLNIFDSFEKKSMQQGYQMLNQFKQICESKNNKLTMQSSIKVLQVLLDQINWINAQEKYQSIILDYLLQWINSFDMQLNVGNSMVIQPITTKLSLKNKMKQISLNALLLKKIQNEDIQQLSQQESINVFSHSIYEHVNIQRDASVKQQYINLLLQFMSNLILKKQKSMVYAYFEHIVEEVKQTTQNNVNKFYMLYLAYSLNRLLNPSIMIPKEITGLKSKIDKKNQINPDLEEQIDEYLSVHYKKHIDLEDIKKSVVTDDRVYKQSKLTLNGLFKPERSAIIFQNNNQQDSHLKNISNQSNGFTKRQSVLNKSDYGQSQGSFQDIMNIMRI